MAVPAAHRLERARQILPAAARRVGPPRRRRHGPRARARAPRGALRRRPRGAAAVAGAARRRVRRRARVDALARPRRRRGRDRPHPRDALRVPADRAQRHRRPPAAAGVRQPDPLLVGAEAELARARRRPPAGRAALLRRPRPRRPRRRPRGRAGRDRDRGHDRGRGAAHRARRSATRRTRGGPRRSSSSPRPRSGRPSRPTRCSRPSRPGGSPRWPWRRRVAARGWAVAAGLLLGACAMLSYGLLLLGILALTVVALGRWWPSLPIAAARRARGRRRLRGARVLLPRGAARSSASATSRASVGRRPASYWTWGGLAALAISAGPLAGAGLAQLGARERSAARSPRSRRQPSPRCWSPTPRR